jgi:hypothetical protein
MLALPHQAMGSYSLGHYASAYTVDVNEEKPWKNPKTKMPISESITQATILGSLLAARQVCAAVPGALRFLLNE